MFSWFRQLFDSRTNVAPTERLDPTETCDDCGAGVGELHALFCTRERCPFCDGQLASCDCIRTVLQLNSEEIRAVDEYVDDSEEPLRSIMERWESALEEKGRIPFRGRKL